MGQAGVIDKAGQLSGGVHRPRKAAGDGHRDCGSIQGHELFVGSSTGTQIPRALAVRLCRDDADSGRFPAANVRN